MGDEVGGREKRAVGQETAHERFGGPCLAGVEVDDGLVDDDELVACECGLDVADDTRVDTAAEKKRVVGRVALRRVHLTVRAREQLVRGRPVGRVHGPADAPVDLDRCAFDPEGAPEGMAHAPHERRGLLVVARPHRENHELVSADAGNGVARANDRLEALRERAEHGVARAVPPDVVHLLEAVEVDDDERELLVGALSRPESLLDPVLEQCPVRQACERVAKGLRACEPEAAVEPDDDSCGDDGDRDEGAQRADRLRAERGRGCAADEDEGGQRQCPSKGPAQMAPVSNFLPVPVVVARLPVARAVHRP